MKIDFRDVRGGTLDFKAQLWYIKYSRHGCYNRRGDDTMNFLCSCCKSRVTNDDRNRHLIEGAGIHNIGYHLAWVECAKEELCLPPDRRKWRLTNQVPMIGERRILKVTAPFDEEIGDTFTTVFEPWQMFLNGWDSAESPDDIGKACAVLCRFEEVLCLDDFSAVISVTVLKTVPFDQLYKVISETVTDERFFEGFGGGQEVFTEYEDEHLLYRTWTAQGDVSQMQLIYTDDKGIRHELLTSWNAMHDDFYYFGNKVNMPLEGEISEETSKYRFFLNGEADNREESEARIAYLEQKYGIVFPDILKDLYSRTDCSGLRGCYIENDSIDCEVYDLVTLENEVRGFEQLVDEIYRAEPLCRHIPDDWFPLAEDEDGDHFFWSSKTHQVYYASQDEPENKILIADSIEEFIDMLNESVDMLPPEPVHSVVEANGCEWDITEQWDNCLIDRCVNKNSLKEVTVPSEFNGKPVVAISDNAFSNDPVSLCRVIETLIMPDTIRHIGSFFFKSCIYLRHIKMPAGLESLGNEAFRGASGLETLAIGDNCVSIGTLFCADAISLRTASIGAGIRTIGDYAFYNTPAMVGFRCNGELRSLGHGSFWMNKWADSQLFRPGAEILRFGRNNSLLYRYVKQDPPMRLYFDDTIRYVFDHAFGGDAWNSGSGITDIYLPGADTVGLQSFKKVPYATVHFSASRMKVSYGPDYEYTIASLCVPAKVVFDLP